jgi:16S rRNA G966 N2-methylase RsmD
LQIVRADAVKFASSLSATGARFDVLFLDPPYKQGWIERLAPLLPQLLKPMTAHSTSRPNTRSKRWMPAATGGRA